VRRAETSSASAWDRRGFFSDDYRVWRCFGFFNSDSVLSAELESGRRLWRLTLYALLPILRKYNMLGLTEIDPRGSGNRPRRWGMTAKAQILFRVRFPFRAGGDPGWCAHGYDHHGSGWLPQLPRRLERGDWARLFFAEVALVNDSLLLAGGDSGPRCWQSWRIFCWGRLERRAARDVKLGGASKQIPFPL